LQTAGFRTTYRKVTVSLHHKQAALIATSVPVRKDSGTAGLGRCAGIPEFHVSVFDLAGGRNPALPAAGEELHDGKRGRGKCRRQKHERVQSYRIHGHSIRGSGKQTFHTFFMLRKMHGIFSENREIPVSKKTSGSLQRTDGG
jgi:hypothetical protein